MPMGELRGILILAFVMVGVPALILKLATIWFVQSAADKIRLRLLIMSLIGCSLAGLITIACYVVLSSLFEFDVQGVRYLPQAFVMVATAALLIVLVTVGEFALWPQVLPNEWRPIEADADWMAVGEQCVGIVGDLANGPVSPVSAHGLVTDESGALNQMCSDPATAHY